MKDGDIPTALASFGQIDGTLAREYDGAGLGLPLVKSFMEMHEGNLEIESKLGEGTIARLVFPAPV
jgi:signal transduction histidine kinase